MRIFGKVLQTIRLPKRQPSCCRPRRYSYMICHYTFGRRLPSHRVARNVGLRSYASKSGSVNKSTSLNENNFSKIIPVALIKSKKIMLIPINLFEGDDDATKKTLNTLSIIREHASQIESFSEKLMEAKTSSEYAMPSSCKTSILGKHSNSDDFTITNGNKANEFAASKRQSNGCIDLYESLEQAIAEHEINRIEAHDFYDVAAWNSSKRQLVACVPESLEEKLKQMAISSMQLAFEMDMSNIRDAILMSSVTKNIDLFKPPTSKSLNNPTISMNTSSKLNSNEPNKCIPLDFNALIKGTVEIDPSKYTPDNLGNIEVPYFNDCVTAIAANICSTALQKGFPADLSRMAYSTKSTLKQRSKSKSNVSSPPIICNSQLTSTDIKRSLSKCGGTGESKDKLDSKSETKAEISLLSTSAIIGDYGPRGLMSCKVYARALEVASKRRAELAECKQKTKTKSKAKIEATRRKDKCGSAMNSPCTRPKRDKCGKIIKPPPKKEKDKKRKIDPCKEDPCKKASGDHQSQCEFKQEAKTKDKTEIEATRKKDRCGSAMDSPCTRPKRDKCGKIIKPPPKKEKDKRRNGDPCNEDPCKKASDDHKPKCAEIKAKERYRPPCTDNDPCLPPRPDPCSGIRKKKREKSKDGGSRKRDPKGPCGSKTDVCKRQKKKSPCPRKKKNKCSLDDPCKHDPCQKKHEEECNNRGKKCSVVTLTEANSSKKCATEIIGPKLKATPSKAEQKCASKCPPLKKSASDSKRTSAEQSRSECSLPCKSPSDCKLKSSERSHSKRQSMEKLDSKCPPFKKSGSGSKLMSAKESSAKCPPLKKSASGLKCSSSKQLRSKRQSIKKSSSSSKLESFKEFRSKCPPLKKAATRSDSKCPPLKKSTSDLKLASAKRSSSKCPPLRKSASDSNNNSCKQSRSECPLLKRSTSASKCESTKRSRPPFKKSAKRTESKCHSLKNTHHITSKRTDSKCPPLKKSATESKCNSSKRSRSNSPTSKKSTSETKFCSSKRSISKKSCLSSKDSTTKTPSSKCPEKTQKPSSNSKSVSSKQPHLRCSPPKKPSCGSKSGSKNHSGSKGASSEKSSSSTKCQKPKQPKCSSSKKSSEEKLPTSKDSSKLASQSNKHIVCTRQGEKGCVSPGNADNKCESSEKSSLDSSKGLQSKKMQSKPPSQCTPPKPSPSDSKCGSPNKSTSKSHKSGKPASESKLKSIKCPPLKKSDQSSGKSTPLKKSVSDSSCGSNQESVSKQRHLKKNAFASQCGSSKRSDSKDKMSISKSKPKSFKCPPLKKTEESGSKSFQLKKSASDSKLKSASKSKSKCLPLKKSSSDPKCGSQERSGSKGSSLKKSRSKSNQKRSSSKCSPLKKTASDSKLNSDKKSKSKCPTLKKTASDSKLGSDKKSKSKCSPLKKTASKSKLGSDKNMKSKCPPLKKTAPDSKLGSDKKSKSKCSTLKTAASDSKLGSDKKSKSKCPPPKKSASESKLVLDKKAKSKCPPFKKTASNSKHSSDKKSKSKCSPLKKSVSDSKLGSDKISKSKCSPLKRAASDSKLGSDKKSESKCRQLKKAASKSKLGSDKKSKSKCPPLKKTASISKHSSDKKLKSKCLPLKKSASDSKLGSDKKSKPKCSPLKKSASDSNLCSNKKPKSKCPPLKVAASKSKLGSGKKSKSKCSPLKKSASDSKCGSDKKSKSKCPPLKKSASDSKLDSDKKSKSKCSPIKKSASDSNCGSDRKSKSKCPPLKKSSSDSKCGSDKKSKSKCQPLKKSASDSKFESDKSKSKGSPRKKTASDSKCGSDKKSKSKCPPLKKSASDSKLGSDKKPKKTASDSKCGSDKRSKSKCPPLKKSASDSKLKSNKRSKSKCPPLKKSSSNAKCASSKKMPAKCEKTSSRSSKSSKSSCKKKRSTAPNCSKRLKKGSSCKRKFSTSTFGNKEIVDILPVRRFFSSLSLVSIKNALPTWRSYSSKKKSSEDKSSASDCDKLKATKPSKRKNILKRRKLKTDCFDAEEECQKAFCRDAKLTACGRKKKENKSSSTLNSSPLTCTSSFSSALLSRSLNMGVVKSTRVQCVKDKEEMSIECGKDEHNIEREDCHADNEVVRIKEPCTVERVLEVVPNYSDYDVLIRTEAIALSGSDLHYYETGGKSFPGMTLGHDATGVIEEVGKCITTLKPGDRVAIESGLSCGICDYCKRGCYNCCSQLIFNGFLRKFQVHPADLCHKLPPNVDIVEATLTQMLAVGCQACFRAQTMPITSLLIIGSCPIAISAALCARAIGVKNICLASAMSEPLEAVEQDFSFNCVYYEHDMQYSMILECLYGALHEWPDAVINCAISEKTMNISVMALKPCGLCVLAECDAECACFNAMDVLMKNLKLLPSFRSINMFPTALSLIESGKAPIGRLIAKQFPWNQVEIAFRSALHESNIGNRKVIVNCAEEENIKEGNTI